MPRPPTAHRRASSEQEPTREPEQAAPSRAKKRRAPGKGGQTSSRTADDLLTQLGARNKQLFVALEQAPAAIQRKCEELQQRSGGQEVELLPTALDWPSQMTKMVQYLVQQISQDEYHYLKQVRVSDALSQRVGERPHFWLFTVKGLEEFVAAIHDRATGRAITAAELNVRIRRQEESIRFQKEGRVACPECHSRFLPRTHPQFARAMNEEDERAEAMLAGKDLQPCPSCKHLVVPVDAAQRMQRLGIDNPGGSEA